MTLAERIELIAFALAVLVGVAVTLAALVVVRLAREKRDDGDR